jgi:hypothetical protein
MIEDSLSRLATSMSRFTIASALFLGRAITDVLLLGKVAEPMYETADVIGKAADAMAGSTRCACSRAGTPQAGGAGSGWGPVRRDE